MFGAGFDVHISDFIDDIFDEEEVIVPGEGCLAGDHVSCKLKDGMIISRHEKSDDRIILAICGRMYLEDSTWEYVAYVPEYESGQLKSTFRIRSEFAKRWEIHPKFVGELGITIRKNNIVRLVHRPDGMHCSNCDEFFDKAGPNQDNGEMICYSCRLNPWR